MKIMSGLFVVMATVATSTHAQIGSVLPLQDLSITGPSGHAIAQVSGLPALPHATFQTTPLAPSLSAEVEYDPKNSSAVFGPFYTFQLIPAPVNSGLDFGSVSTLQFLILRAHGGTGFIGIGYVAPTAVLVGADFNGDGLPEEDEILCKTNFATSTSDASCLIDISASAIGKQPTNYWFIVQLPNYFDPREGFFSSSEYAFLTMATSTDSAGTPSVQTSAGQTIVTGPGHLDAGAAFPIRLSTGTVSPFPAWQSYFGAVLIDTDAAGGTGKAGVLPFSLTRQAGSDDTVIATTAPLAAAGVSGTYVAGFGGTQAPVPIASGETLQHWFFDLPPTTDGSQYGPISFVINAKLEQGYSDAPSVDFALVRADFPAQSASPVIAAAPPITATDYHATINGATTIQLNSFAPGRWYIVAKNNSVGEVQFSLTLYNGTDGGEVLCPSCGPGAARLNAGPNPTIAPGTYYNRQRSGHGIFLSQASGQQVVNWFTFLEDGTPTWYTAQADAPDPTSGWWTAPVYRVAYDGSRATPTPIGSITLTPMATNQPIFTWNIEGQSGSEVFELLAATNSCPTLNGDVTNFNGSWYAPTQSGYGMDVLALPGQQFDAFYFYDSLGLARWGVGSSTPFTASSSLNLVQSSGFCPACAYQKLTTQPLGTLSVDYASATNGNYSTSINLQAPLSGTWNINQPMQRLTGSAVCGQ